MYCYVLPITIHVDHLHRLGLEGGADLHPERGFTNESSTPQTRHAHAPGEFANLAFGSSISSIAPTFSSIAAMSAAFIWRTSSETGCVGLSSKRGSTARAPTGRPFLDDRKPPIVRAIDDGFNTPNCRDRGELVMERMWIRWRRGRKVFPELPRAGGPRTKAVISRLCNSQSTSALEIPPVFVLNA